MQRAPVWHWLPSGQLPFAPHTATATSRSTCAGDPSGRRPRRSANVWVWTQSARAASQVYPADAGQPGRPLAMRVQVASSRQTVGAQ